MTSRVRRGKAPPIDPFTGEDPEFLLDDWIPTLRRAADWNGWTEGNLLIQLAGHLKGREWNLIHDDEKRTYLQATVALRGRLDPGSRIMAAQYFWHALQYILRLEQLFKLAYSLDPINSPLWTAAGGGGTLNHGISGCVGRNRLSEPLFSSKVRRETVGRDQEAPPISH